MKSNNVNSPVEVFSGTIWQAEFVKSLLANAEIEGYLNDEMIGTMAPWVTSNAGVGAVKVMVSNFDYDKAKTVVDEYMKNNT
jgi:hypothetical protein